MKFHRLALLLALAAATLTPQCAGHDESAPVVTDESETASHPIVVIPRVSYEGGGGKTKPTSTTGAGASTVVSSVEEDDLAFIRNKWHQLTPPMGAIYRDRVGRLTNKLGTLRDLITAGELGRQKRGLPLIHRSAPLGFSHDDWVLVNHLGPAIKASSDLLSAAPRDALRTLRRLLKVAQEEPKKRLGALFSKEAASRLHSVMVHIQERLVHTDPSEIHNVSSEEAIRLVEDILGSTSSAPKVTKRRRRPRAAK